MYVTNTHLKPVIGIDIHFVNTPIPFVPLPHPYIGLVIDPFDYIPFIGAIVGQPVRAVGEAMKAGKLDPNLLVISYTVRPTGEVVTLNNRGLAALTIAGKNPEMAIKVPYDKVPAHLKSDPPSHSINLTNDKKGLEIVETVTRCH